MENEPIAWMTENGYLITKDENLANIIKEKGEEPIIPLYTYEQITPSGFLNASKPIYPAKTLTDEEIRHIQAQCHLKDVGYDTFIMRFARAILRKAQEKCTK